MHFENLQRHLHIGAFKQKNCQTMHAYRRILIRETKNVDPCGSRIKNIEANKWENVENKTCGSAHIVAPDGSLAEPTLHAHREHHVRQDGDGGLKHAQIK